jgi:hypothetical protein
LVAALVALPTAAAAVPGRLDGATTRPTAGAAQRSTARVAARTTIVARPIAVAARPTTSKPQRSTASSATARRGGTATLISVKVTTAKDDPGTVSRDLLRQPGRRVQRAGCSNPGPGGPDYSLTGSRVGGPTTAHFNPAGAPLAGAASVFQAAFSAWTAVDGNAPGISVASDGTVSTPTADHTYEIMFAPLGSRTLGVTYTWHWSTGEYESDTVFSSNVPWFVATGEGDGCYEGIARYDLQDTATHEFGHVYGLGHVTDTFNTMFPSAAMGETFKRSPAVGDANGMHALY